MPRPGPRPYECVRRAWHSDRHQPMRGSLIQEIFRLANDVHGSATRKNKEWQQKLPFVVLKAEEIMYSKANSEAEYVDVATLFERVNDAIDTIIRRDESESGDLLQPCIEAALNLGCIPRRASRSQRHNSPRCYLSSGIQESVENSNTSPCNPDIGNRPYHQVIPSSLPMRMVPTGSPQNNTHQFVPWYLSHSSPGVPVTANCGFIGTESLGIPQDHREVPSHEFRVPSPHSENEKFQNFPLEVHGGSTTARVYPLHYAGNQNLRLLSTDHNAASRSSTLAANNFPDSHVSLCETNCLRQGSQPILRHMTHMLPLLPRDPSHIEQDKHLFSPDVYPKLSHSTFHPSHYVQDRGNIWNFTTSNCNTFGPSVSFDPCKWDDEKYQLHNFLGVNQGERTPLVNANTIGMHRGARDSGCDLSLRLGQPLLPCVGGGCVWSRGVEDIGSSSSHVRTKFLEFDCSPSSLE